MNTNKNSPISNNSVEITLHAAIIESVNNTGEQKLYGNNIILLIQLKLYGNTKKETMVQYYSYNIHAKYHQWWCTNPNHTIL